MIRHIIDGETVLEYSRPQLDDGTPLAGGTISLQAESHPVEFRKVELLRLDPGKGSHAMKELNVALIGYEFMGRAHSNAWRQVGPFMSPRLDRA